MHVDFQARSGRSISVGLVIVAVCATFLDQRLSAQSAAGHLELATVSARPDMVSGGDVLVRVVAPRAVPLTQIKVALNDTDVTSRFRAEAATNTLLGLVSGLTPGSNSLTAAIVGHSDRAATPLTLVNYPSTGPIFSGPHEQPFICETDAFELQSGATLGRALDANCSIATRVDYYYRAAGAKALKPLPSGAVPAGIARATTSAGVSVPYIVRIETGTINRAIYQIAMLHDPSSGATPDVWNASPSIARNPSPGRCPPAGPDQAEAPERWSSLNHFTLTVKHPVRKSCVGVVRSSTSRNITSN